MTVTSTTSSVSYYGDGVADAFPTVFRFLDPAHLVVSVDGATLSEGSDYTVSGAGDDAGGTVTLLAGPLDVESLIEIKRTLPLTQPTSFRAQGDFSPRVHEDALDRLAMQVQQVAREASGDLPWVNSLYARVSALESQVSALQSWRAAVGQVVRVSDPIDVGASFSPGHAAFFSAPVSGWKMTDRLLVALDVDSSGPIPARMNVAAVMTSTSEVRVSLHNAGGDPQNLLGVRLRVIALGAA